MAAAINIENLIRDLLNDLINVLASTIGALSNPSKIETTFKSVIQSAYSLPDAEKIRKL